MTSLWKIINVGADSYLLDEVMEKTSRKLAVPLFQVITSENCSYRGAESAGRSLVRWVLE